MVHKGEKEARDTQPEVSVTMENRGVEQEKERKEKQNHVIMNKHGTVSWGKSCLDYRSPAGTRRYQERTIRK
jgi:ribulose-5-phosphate 4-epimerase/fuculose-1-phosphate aldolase